MRVHFQIIALGNEIVVPFVKQQLSAKKAKYTHANHTEGQVCEAHPSSLTVTIDRPGSQVLEHAHCRAYASSTTNAALRQAGARICQVGERVVKQYLMVPYDDPAHHGMFDDYLHLCFQFGYAQLDLVVSTI